MTIAPVILFVIFQGGAFPVQFYDMTACEKAKVELKKLEKSLVTKCLVTQTIIIKPDI